MSDHRTKSVKHARILAGTSLAVLLGSFALHSEPSAAAGAGGLQLAMMDEMKNRMGGMSGGMPQREMSGMGGMSGGMGSSATDSSRGSMREMEMRGMGSSSMGMPPGGGTNMAMPSALPGFPGASHIYHVGATGFFLDYSAKLGFSIEQTASLNGIKQRALTEQSSTQRKIDEAEQAFWLITAADQPDINSVESKLRDIEKLRSDMRLAFIRAVGEAAKILNADQRKMVLGLAPMPASSGGAATR